VLPSHSLPPPESEAERLESLRGYEVLDTASEASFDDITELASSICNTPIALVSLVDAERQWFKSRVGTEQRQIPREGAFCDHAIRHPDRVTLVRDASLDPRFAANPLVTAMQGVRFYAGAPLVSPEGHALGTLCVIDTQARDLSPAQIKALATLSRQVMTQLELRRQHRELARTVAHHSADLIALQSLQAALTEREQRLARIAAQLPGVVYQYHMRPDGTTCFSYASEGLRDIYGMAPEDVRQDSSPVTRILHPEDRDRVTQSIAASATTLRLWDCEYRIVRPDAGTRWVQGRATPERLADGGTLWHGFITDITQRKAAEQLLRERDAVLQQAQRLAGLGSWRWNNAAGQSEWAWSEQTYRLFGVDPASFEVSDASFMSVIHPEDRLAVEDAHREALAGRRPYDLRYRAVTPAGELRHLHGRAELVPDEGDSQSKTMIGTVLDISERVAVEAELARHRDELERRVLERTRELTVARDAAELASRAKGDFLSSMSHELRTPMNAILGFSQLLELDRTLDAREAGHVREIMRAGHHLLTLINEVLDLAHIDSGRLTLSPEPLSLAELVAEAQALVQPLAQQRGVTIDAAPLEGLVVLADRLRLKQVLLNLLSNAVKYNRPGGSVTIDAHDQDLFAVRIRVRDTGIGIATPDLAKLFQPFSRIAGSAVEGTGIGLSIAQRLVTMMNGRIGVSSTPGQGSEFWIELPSDRMAELPPLGEDPGTRVLSSRAGRPATVLYVEDNPSNLKLVELIMQRHPGVELLMAPSGSLGLELARSHRPDLLLLDIHMPDLDGFQVLSRLRADPLTRAIPVVAVTAQAMVDDVKRIMAAGFDAYLPKPLDLGSFDALLERMLKTTRSA
jgi:PAS domain S-box-containing protein